MGQIDWFDVAPAIAFAFVAGMLARFVGGKSSRAVLAGSAYIVGAGFVAAAAVAFLGFDGAAGFGASTAVSAVLVVPLWLYVNAAERTPVSEAEMNWTIAEAARIGTGLSGDDGDQDRWDTAEIARGQFDNLLWRLAPDSPRRPELIAAKDRLEQAMASAAGARSADAGKKL